MRLHQCKSLLLQTQQMGDPRDDRPVSLHDADAGVHALVHFCAQPSGRSLEYLQVCESANGEHGSV